MYPNKSQDMLFTAAACLVLGLVMFFGSLLDAFSEDKNDDGLIGVVVSLALIGAAFMCVCSFLKMSFMSIVPHVKRSRS